MANYPTPHLRAYMLRFWQVRSGDANHPPTWRFSLEDPHSGDRLGFADLEAMISFLRTELTRAELTNPSQEAGRGQHPQVGG